jgi:hypothetical protein
MEVSGKIKVIGNTTEVGATFKKRELVVITDEQYPQTILIEFVQDKCDILDKYAVGQNVSVGINLRGREWVNPQGETKYFNSLQGWKIDKTESVQQMPPIPVADNFKPATDYKEEEHDDLPF